MTLYEQKSFKNQTDKSLKSNGIYLNTDSNNWSSY